MKNAIESTEAASIVDSSQPPVQLIKSVAHGSRHRGSEGPDTGKWPRVGHPRDDPIIGETTVTRPDPLSCAKEGRPELGVEEAKAEDIAGAHFEQSRAQGEHIGAERDIRVFTVKAHQHFRRTVPDIAGCAVVVWKEWGGIGINVCRSSEVGQSDAVVVHHEEVGGFQIAVRDSSGMDTLDSPAYRAKRYEEAVDGPRAVGDDAANIGTGEFDSVVLDCHGPLKSGRMSE